MALSFTSLLMKSDPEIAKPSYFIFNSWDRVGSIFYFAGPLASQIRKAKNLEIIQHYLYKRVQKFTGSDFWSTYQQLPRSGMTTAPNPPFHDFFTIVRDLEQFKLLPSRSFAHFFKDSFCGEILAHKSHFLYSSSGCNVVIWTNYEKWQQSTTATKDLRLFIHALSLAPNFNPQNVEIQSSTEFLRTLNSNDQDRKENL